MNGRLKRTERKTQAHGMEDSSARNGRTTFDGRQWRGIMLLVRMTGIVIDRVR
jgi:hypothetical protein